MIDDFLGLSFIIYQRSTHSTTVMISFGLRNRNICSLNFHIWNLRNSYPDGRFLRFFTLSESTDVWMLGITSYDYFFLINWSQIVPTARRWNIQKTRWYSFENYILNFAMKMLIILYQLIQNCSEYVVTDCHQIDQIFNSNIGTWKHFVCRELILSKYG